MRLEEKDDEESRKETQMFANILLFMVGIEMYGCITVLKLYIIYTFLICQGGQAQVPKLSKTVNITLITFKLDSINY